MRHESTGNGGTIPGWPCRAPTPSTPRRWCRRPLSRRRASVAKQPPLFARGGLIYEINVRGFSMLHPDIAPAERGTLAALRHPAVIAHLQALGVSAVELMPVTAWIDERHLPPLGLANAWGYNPVTFMAMEPRLAPGGIADLRRRVEALHGAGIGVILDLVFNHTGESDRHGATLSLRGMDNHAAYRHDRQDRRPARQRHRLRQHALPATIRRCAR